MRPSRDNTRAWREPGVFSSRFSNSQSKLRSVVPDYRAVIPFEQGAREIVAWHDEDPARQRVDARLDAVMDKLIDAYRP